MVLSGNHQRVDRRCRCCRRLRYTLIGVLAEALKTAEKNTLLKASCGSVFIDSFAAVLLEGKHIRASCVDLSCLSKRSLGREAWRPKDKFANYIAVVLLSMSQGCVAPRLRARACANASVCVCVFV